MREFCRRLSKAATGLPLLVEAWQAVKVADRSPRHVAAAVLASVSAAAAVVFVPPLLWWAFALPSSGRAGLAALGLAVVSVASAIGWAVADPEDPS